MSAEPPNHGDPIGPDGAGDADGHDRARSLARLWGVADLHAQPRRGPKPKHSVETVVQAAIALADAEGLDALSMRRVAEMLRLSPMSLYTYVPSKAELLDLMLDHVVGEIAEPKTGEGDWREQVTQLARQRWMIAQRHPWIMEAGMRRPPLGPNVLAKAEAALRAVDGIGLSEAEMDQVTTLVANYVRGAVRGMLDAAEIERASGMTDEQWWSQQGPLLAGLIDPSRYPTTVRIGEAYKAGRIPRGDRERNFEFGLARLLDGVETYIRTRK
ncbi:MAG: TetR/AcrR family transcriptional regulator C-terminal domain-containing protein [Proteobacteria bacterium]|nr:TetR/AcrR family transcriptional regulator C-terminal domain-containing protein [Pseudomonadota bacterium]